MVISVTKGRCLLAWASVALAVLGTVAAGCSMYQQSAVGWRTNHVKQNGPEIGLTPAHQEALKMRLDSASRVFQTGLAVTAALWALVTALLVQLFVDGGRAFMARRRSRVAAS